MIEFQKQMLFSELFKQNTFTFDFNFSNKTQAH